MSIVIADDNLATELARTSGPTKIQSRDGKPLGIFTPESLPAVVLAPKITAEELRRREADVSSPEYSLEELLHKLKGE